MVTPGAVHRHAYLAPHPLISLCECSCRRRGSPVGTRAARSVVPRASERLEHSRGRAPRCIRTSSAGRSRGGSPRYWAGKREIGADMLSDIYVTTACGVSPRPRATDLRAIRMSSAHSRRTIECRKRALHADLTTATDPGETWHARTACVPLRVELAVERRRGDWSRRWLEELSRPDAASRSPILVMSRFTCAADAAATVRGTEFGAHDVGSRDL